MTTHGPEFARVDAQECLIEASPRLAALNARAGGRTGAPMALPPLAAVARVALSMRIPVSRLVVVADGECDVELRVTARLESDGCRLDVDGWTSRSARRSWLIEGPDADVTAGANWTWRSDAALRLTALVLSDGGDGLRGSDLIGQPLTRLVRLIEDEEGDLPILAALAAAAPFAEQRAVRRDRPNEEVVLSADPVFAEDGRFAGFSGRATGHVSVNERAEALPQPADNDFVDRLSEAFRAPLDRIVARAGTISAQADGPLRRDYVDYAGDIGSAARHLIGLVDGLSDLQAVEQPGFRLPTEPVDIADVARRAAGLLAVRAADKQVRIDRPDAEDVLIAQGDFQRVLQILVNLLTNAVRYTPAGGMVWLRTEIEGDSAIVVVADQGKGIAPEDHARVFGKFERVDPSEPGGSGLGLYISRALARAMGGDITLDSAPGQGARFVLTLPVA